MVVQECSDPSLSNAIIDCLDNANGKEKLLAKKNDTSLFKFQLWNWWDSQMDIEE